MNLITYNFLGTGGTVTASAADIAIVDHNLVISGGPTIDTRLIESMVMKAPVAETPGVWTTTFTAAASKRYALEVRQMRQDLGYEISRVLEYTSKADGTDTATTIGDALDAQLLFFPELKMVSSGTTTFILTASAGYPMFRVRSIGDGVAAVVNGTPGVSALGTPTSIGYIVPVVTGAVAGQTYLSMAVVWKTSGTSENIAGTLSMGRNQHTIYINVGATNYAVLLTRITEFSNGFGAGVTTANPEAIALGNGLTT